ncbi:3 5 -cyclic nucleotide phosphodiesterase domain-containing protein [Cystoisospora suis]|uniref:3 5-cyclic nucleotide phosphodiesterase domain-containing protein n=1 Tax=Cystoisospora suis TaxID=483139 RepID=A0A2C6KH41_9APIC|nr:3 5 -cyclic nucleotide phosphodiesterase domain-containing protein [Cystoisospora suis]
MQQGDFPRSITEDKSLVLCNLMNAANYSFLGRPLQLYLQWSQKYMDELFLQGDRELELDFPITKNCDRNTASEAAVQLGLIDGWAVPIYSALSQILPKLNSTALAHLKRNRLHWVDEQQEDEKSKDKAGKSAPTKGFSKKPGSGEAVNGDMSKTQRSPSDGGGEGATGPELRVSAIKMADSVPD